MSHKFVIYFYAADQADDGPDGIDELRAGVEVGGDHHGRVVDSGQAVALGKGGGSGGHYEGRRQQDFFLVHRLFVAFSGGAGDG